MKIYFLIILIIILLVITINNNLLLKKESRLLLLKNNTIDLVISRYNEDLEWTVQEPYINYKYIVYNKGPNDRFNKTNVKKIINVKNVGRCDHTYLYHIITNYNNLGDIVIFLPGSIDLFYKNLISQKLFDLIENEGKAYFLGFKINNLKRDKYDFTLDNYVASYGPNFNENRESKLLPASPRPYGKWFEKKFGNIIVKQHCYLGIFSIDKRDIIQHPKSYYKSLIKDVETHSNPEAGHYFERSWAAVFHPLNHTVYKNYFDFS